MTYDHGIREKMINKSFFFWSRKIIIKILPWVLLFICLSFATLIILGYHSASRPISYLPRIQPVSLKQNKNSLKQIELKNPGYILEVQEDGKILVKSFEGDTIISNITYYADYEGVDEKWGLNNISTLLTSDSTISITGEGPSGVVVCLYLTVPENSARLDVSIKTSYKRNFVVRRESLLAQFNVSVSEVYQKNRQVNFGPFDSEYWLKQEGVRFGNGSGSALVYHTPYVSSLQLDTRKNLLCVNLDYYLDHPFINIPFQKDGGGKWIDLSKAEYIAGNERSNKFSINFGIAPRITPRIMLVPKGYLAGYIFTEHADGGTIRTHRAAYFGSEDISNIHDAVGGFAGHKIPVTKSVFYYDPEGPFSSIRDDPDKPQFLDFLDQLNESGYYEICLHTPEGSNSNRKMLEESIKFMKNRFDTRSWIDHGMYSGQTNRESFVAEGLNPNSVYYSADLWEKYGTRYFWSSAVELIRKYSEKENLLKLKLYDVSVNLWKRYLSPDELNKIRFITALREMVSRFHEKEELNSLLTYKGNAFPTPLYWQHPTQTRNFYSWTTDYVKQYSSLSEKKVDLENKLLNKLISEWGVFINHGYFVRNGPADGNLINLNEKLVVNPYFDKILENMAKMRDEGDLYITTIRDLLDYWILIEKVSFNYLKDGFIYVINSNEKPIKDLSLVVHAKTVRINGEIPRLKHIGEETIFWFDIPANQSMCIQVEQ